MNRLAQSSAVGLGLVVDRPVRSHRRVLTSERSVGS